MNMVRAVYEGGVFRPVLPVNLPESCEVEFVPHPVGQVQEPVFISDPQLTVEEFRQLLDEMAASPPSRVLPADFSRADIYDDHD